MLQNHLIRFIKGSENYSGSFADTTPYNGCSLIVASRTFSNVFLILKLYFVYFQFSKTFLQPYFFFCNTVPKLLVFLLHINSAVQIAPYNTLRRNGGSNAQNSRLTLIWFRLLLLFYLNFDWFNHMCFSTLLILNQQVYCWYYLYVCMLHINQRSDNGIL